MLKAASVASEPGGDSEASAPAVVEAAIEPPPPRPERAVSSRPVTAYQGADTVTLRDRSRSRSRSRSSGQFEPAQSKPSKKTRIQK